MNEAIGNNSALPKEGVSKGKEIPIKSLSRGILSIEDETKRVEVTRITLHYLLEKSRILDSVQLLIEIDAEKFPFHEGERNNMLKSILDVAESRCKEDPVNAYLTIVYIRENSMEGTERKHDGGLLTQEEYGKFDKEAFANTSAIVTGRLIECMLDPSLPRGQRGQGMNWSNIEHFVRRADERGYFERIYKSFPPEVRQQLDPHIPESIKKKLGEIQKDNGETSRPPEMTHEETETAHKPVIEKVTADEIIASTENIVSMENVSPADLPEKLNELLRQNKGESHLTVSVPPDLLQRSIISMAKGYKVEAGTVEVDRDNNKITIKNVQVKKNLGKVTFDLTLANGIDGITADVHSYNANLAAKMFGGNVTDSIKGMNPAVKKYLDQQIGADNPLWLTQNISIQGGIVLIRFEKLPEAETAKPPAAAETLKLQVPAEEQETKIEVSPATKEDKAEHGETAVRLAINGKDTGLFWSSWTNGEFSLPLNQVKSEYSFDLPPGLVFLQLVGPDGEYQIITMGGDNAKVIVFPRQRWDINDTRLLTKESGLYVSYFDKLHKGKAKITRWGILASASVVNEWFPVSEMGERVRILNASPQSKSN